MSAVTIRLAHPDDLARLSAIETSAAETFAAAGYGDWLADGSPPAPEGYWAGSLDAGLLWVADDASDGPVGFLAGKLTEDGLHVEEVDVVIERQKQGHGRRLMEAAIGYARERRLAAVTLTTFRAIAWNAPFYAQLGFEELAPQALSPHLASVLAGEAARGFKGRCAMRLAL